MMSGRHQESSGRSSIDHMPPSGSHHMGQVLRVILKDTRGTRLQDLLSGTVKDLEWRRCNPGHYLA